MMNICIACGARPNFIKVAPIVRAVEKAQQAGENVDYQLVYVGRENDPTLEPSLFADLGIRRPDVFLDVDDASLNVLAAGVMCKFDAYLATHPVDVVIVVDDLASTMSIAITTKKRGIRLAHLVAGTRSFDINMPKEINRLVIDGLSDLLFTAGAGSDSNVNREGGEMSKTYMVGNILMDTLRFHHDDFRRPMLSLPFRLEEKKYLVFTLNRKALMADEANLRRMLRSMSAAAQGMPVVAPLREAARRAVERAWSEATGIYVVGPLSYLEFGWLTAHACGIITDSGNVAEEATFNGVPCITLNSYTEHIETVQVGSNVLVGEDAARLGEAVGRMVGGHWKACGLPDRWDGRSAERIIHILLGK